MNPEPPGLLAEPASGSGSAVLLLHAWWGLNGTMNDFARSLAGEGFIVFAPDLCDGRIATTIPQAEALVGELDEDRAKTDVAAAARFLGKRSGDAEADLAVVGFSLGAYYALDLAGAQPGRVRSVVLYYGTGYPNAETSRAAYLGHFAGDDEFEPPASVDGLEEALKKAGRTATFHRYPGTGHWFAEPDRKDAYDRVAAELAWKRTLEFLRSRPV